MSCGDDKPTKAQKAELKRAQDEQLLALPYPTSTGRQPATMTLSYDDATGRTNATLRLTGLRVSGRRASNVSGATLHLTSSYKGHERAPDNPEGSVDGSIIVQTSAPGVLAFAGPPGTVTADGRITPLKKASGKDGYSSADGPSGRDEVVRFRFPTEDVVAAAHSSRVTISFGGIEIELSGAHLTDLREFAARLNPKP